MSNLATGSMAALMSMTTLRKKKKGKHSSTVAQSSTFSPLLRDGPSTSLNTVTFPPERGRGVPTLTPAPRFGVSPPAQNENLSKADLTTTSRSDAEVTPKTPMPPAALYSIIAAGGVFFILAIIFACICFRRRKNQDRQTADWYGIQEKRLSGTTFGGPGKGPVTRKMQLSDDDSYLDDEKYSEPDAIANVPTHILFKFPKLGKESKGTGQQEKPMEISKPFGMNLHVTNPDFVPTRPPRPSAHIDLGHPGNLTPMNALKEDDNIIDDDEEDDEEEVYERNILALTTSMAFDTPRDRQSRAFDPSLPLPDSADIGTSMKDGRDTIVVSPLNILSDCSYAKNCFRCQIGLRRELWCCEQSSASRGNSSSPSITYQKPFDSHHPQQEATILPGRKGKVPTIRRK